MSKSGRKILLHKSSGVYHVRASALSEPEPVEDQEPRNDAEPPAGAVGEAAAPCDTDVCTYTDNLYATFCAHSCEPSGGNGDGCWNDD